MDWRQAIKQWRELPEEEEDRRRWANIQRSGAASFAFEGEPVEPAMLEAERAKQSMPQPTPKPAIPGTPSVAPPVDEAD